MPRRIVIHAGFHKTATSSVQQILRVNRPLLKPVMRSVLKGGMTDLIHAARGYSTWRDPLTLEKFARRFEALLSHQSNMPRRTLCLSAEELAGHMPGRGALVDYTAAAVLAAEMMRIAGQLFPEADLALFYSTRAPKAWLHSAYWEHVKSSSMTLGWNEFADTYGAAGDLDRVVDDIAAAHPGKVHRARLEQSAHLPAGPATPVLDLCGVTRDVQTRLTLPPPANQQRDEAVLLALLAANRDYPDRDARQAAKLAILKAIQEETR
ncbi:MAG: hypothetical protein COC12_01510 [Rhodobacteraceae bacterium]|nr:MAG: hypothetical protein COC12_01510 [Paracoccaceae bacterium]